MPRSRDTHVDVDRLIDLVQQHDCLYDFLHPDHRDAHLTKSIWDTIGWELNSTGMVVKQKWRSRRDGYVRLRKEILANHNNPQVTAKARRWKYYSRLSFLAPFMEDPVPGSPGIHNSSGALSLDPTEQTPSPAGSPLSTVSPSSLEKSTHQSRTASVKTRGRSAAHLETLPGVGQFHIKEERMDCEQEGQAMLDVLAGRCSHVLPREDDGGGSLPDGDDLFMASCAVQLKELPPRERWEAKMEIMDVLYRKKFPSPPVFSSTGPVQEMVPEEGEHITDNDESAPKQMT